MHGYQELIPSTTKSEKDRHVLAAAVRANAELIITYNIKTFLMLHLPRFNYGTMTEHFPDESLPSRSKRSPQALEQQAAALNRRVEYVLDRLHINVPHFVDVIRSHISNRIFAALNLIGHQGTILTPCTRSRHAT